MIFMNANKSPSTTAMQPSSKVSGTQQALVMLLIITLIVSFCGCRNEKQDGTVHGDYVTVPVFDKIKESLGNRELSLSTIVQGNSELSLSTFVEKIDIIPLEFTDDCILSEINKVVIHDNNIFIMERNSNSCKIYRFDMQGNFLNSIGSPGQGPQELLALEDFSINEDNNTVYILDNVKQMIYHFDFNGRFIERIVIDPDADRFEYKNGLFYIYCDHPNEGEYLFNLIIRNIKGDVLAVYFPSKQYISTTSAKPFTKTNNALLFNPTFDYMVYELNEDSLKNLFLFDFGSYRFTQEEIDDTYMMRKRTIDILLNNERFSDIDDICYVGKWIYFNAVYKFFPYSFLYDTNKNEIDVAERLIDDIEYMFSDNKFYGQTQDALIGCFVPETSLNHILERFSNYDILPHIPRDIKDKQLKKVKSIMRGDKQNDMNPWILLYYLKD